MAKSKANFVCQSCGSAHPRWNGKCEACGGWNTIVEEIAESGAPKGLAATKSKGRRIETTSLRGKAANYQRMISGINEYDRVHGGGLVPGSASLIGGDPGIGKSTLLLQAVCAMANKGHKCLYVSGEEAVDQVRLRADRLGLADAPVDLAAATDVRNIAATVQDQADGRYDLVIIDSIQTMYIDTIDSAPGTVSQVRTCAQELIRVCKSQNTAVIFVGHVTKEGQIAGPRVLEHMVDAVIYFEGERGHHFRILRAVKNRFGPVDEIGVFEMAEQGLVEVSNPSALFLAQRQDHVAGSCVLAGMEGTRPVLVEIQALVSPTQYSTPRRAVIGWDSGRLSMLVAVLETRMGYEFAMNEIYLNVAGGLKINETAADLAVAAALISALTNKPVPADTVFFGEVGLAGEVRPVNQMDLRLKEAAKLGFKRAVIPKPPKDNNFKKSGLDHVEPIKSLDALHELFSGGSIEQFG